MIGDGGKVKRVMSQSEDIILEMKNNYKHKKIKMIILMKTITVTL
jgi:hypothetical protein